MLVRLKTASLALLLALTTPLSVVAQAADNSDSPRRVLLIYSSTDIGEWQQTFNSVILRELSVDSRSLVAPEFLSLIDASEEQIELAAASLELQYSQTPPDLVIAVSPEAGTFVRRWSHSFAPGARHLYVLPGTDILDDPALPGDDVILRSAVSEAAENTLTLIPTLLPDLQELIVAGGSAAGDLSYSEQIEDILAELNLPLQTRVLHGPTPAELVELLNDAPERSALLLTMFNLDHTGQPQRAVLINDYLDDEVTKPVFSLFDTQIGHGSIGGNMSTASEYADTAAELALTMLQGGQPPVLVSGPTQYIFDGEKLNQFNIDRSLLPPGSIIRNDPVDPLRDNAIWIVGVSVVIVAQLVLIALLLNAIRRRKLVEEELKTTQKMEALGNLAGGIAHDFNNILMAIMANAELAKTTLRDPERADKRLNNILSASNRAKGLISQILLFSRQAATQSFEEVNLEPLLHESVDQISAFLPRGCELELDCEGPLPAVMADDNQLHQAIMNICINAQHAMNNNGTIVLHAGSETLTEPRKLFGQDIPAGTYVTISITDTGKGIDDKHLHHIFEPFYTTKPQGKGTGLGLAMVYRIVRNHDGFIDVETRSGDGTTFTIYLKASSQVIPESASEEKLASVQGRGESILLVDDDDMVLDATCRTLEKLGYRVRAFRSSLQALQTFKESPQQWDLLFTDLSMPEMDGARLGAQIRQLRPELPIILYTGYLDAVDAIDLDDLRILSKPSRIDDIAQAVATALGSDQQQGQVP